jgi:hypothetical protein
MKKQVFLSLLLIPVLSGCDLLEKAKNIEISTQITADIPVAVVESGKKSLDLSSGVSAANFSTTFYLSLSSNEDIEPYLSKIKDINLESLVVTVNGLSSGQSINTVSLDVTGVGNLFTQNNITMTNNSFTPEINASRFDQVAAKLMDDGSIQFVISGNASGPMTFLLNLNFDATVTAEAI